MTLARPALRYPASRLTLLLIGITFCLGCHRQYYRKQADGEAHALIAEKAFDVARPPNIPIHVYVDRRSRMFNPFDLDFQPLPLDDPASYRYMQCVDGRRGYPMWEAAGITNTAESPDWWQFLPLDDDGVLVLNAENAVRIALLHSRDYQQQIEQLYLNALQVSGQRFVFDTQFFGRTQNFVQTDRGGPTTLGIGRDRGVDGNRISFQREFATGGQLVTGLANSIVWTLGGNGDQRVTTGLVDFAFVQPLLLNAGRDKVLENLTFSERQLLASVRSFERFRRTFFLNITVGAQVQTIVQTAVGEISVNPAGFGVTGGNSGGFLGLLQNELQIRNSQENITRQTENLLILEDTLIELLTTIPDDAESIVRQRLQVAQARQQLLSSQSALVNQQASFQRSLDGFLRTLGLPPYICVRLDDPILDRFELIDRDLLTRREELSTLRAKVGGINVSILEKGEFKLDPDTGLPVSEIPWTPELAESLEVLRKELQPLAAFIEDLIKNDLPTIAKDIENLAEALPQRRKQNTKLLELYRTEQQSICGLLNVSDLDESIFEIEELSGLPDQLRDAHAKLAERLQEYVTRVENLQQAFEKLQAEGVESTDPRELAQRLRDAIILASQDLVAELGDDVLLLQLIQARARTESVLLPEVDIDPETAFQIARKNRRDWANARASLVDAWRQIEVTADDLESRLDVELGGNLGNQNLGGNLGNQGFGQLNARLVWDAPITRLVERNAYRTTLIRYEQSKRSYYNFEDSVWQQLRAEIRQLQANRLTFEFGRQAVRIAAQQIELNADLRALNDARGQQSAGPTAARDAISALTDLLNAQNGLLNIFVNYEVVRRGLDLDLGTMELTPEGLWIDPGAISPEALLALPGTTAAGMIEHGCNDCGLRYNPLPPEPEFTSRMIQAGQIDEDEVSLPPPVNMQAEAAQEPLDELPATSDQLSTPDPGEVELLPIDQPPIAPN